MVLLVLLVHKDKIGMQQLDHAVAHLDKTGTVLFVFHVLVVDNGMLHQKIAFVPMETGMDSHVFNVLLVKNGMLQVSAVLAQIVPTGMVFHV
jgi:hypothetical protein